MEQLLPDSFSGAPQSLRRRLSFHYPAHLKLSTAAAVETRRQVLHYLTKNRYAMDYARYEQAGWPRGSGAVEGGCRLIGARTNGCGRRWGEPGCDAIVALRVAVLNARLDLLLPKPKSRLLRAA